jgi:hypothetical protein
VFVANIDADHAKINTLLVDAIRCYYHYCGYTPDLAAITCDFLVQTLSIETQVESQTEFSKAKILIVLCSAMLTHIKVAMIEHKSTDPANRMVAKALSKAADSVLDLIEARTITPINADVNVRFAYRKTREVITTYKDFIQ